MRTRDYVLVNAQTLSDSQTFTKDLPSPAKIQELRVIYSATNGATSNTLGKIVAMVSKILVDNGSDVLHSLSGREEQAINCYRHGHFPYKYLTSKAAGVVVEEFIINFGRYRGDREYYLDTATYKNAKLSLTHALTIDGSLGFATGTGVLTVIARLIEDGAPPYKGFLMQKEIDSFASAASGTNVTELPLDYPYQALMVADLETTIEADVDISNLKLSQDSDKFIPFDLSTTRILQGNMGKYGPCRESLHFLNDTAVTWLGDLYARTKAYASPGGATAKTNVTSSIAEQIIAAMTTGDAADLQLTLEGAAPHSNLYLPFGTGEMAEDFFPVSGVGSLELTSTLGAAGGACTVVASQLRV